MKTPQQIKNEVKKGCGVWSEGKVKGVTFQTQCGNTGFKDKICLCEVCQAKLSILTEYDKSIKEMIEKVYQYLKENEDEKLNSFPDEVAIRLQSGFLLGYADGIVKFREKLLSKIGEEKQDDK